MKMQALYLRSVIFGIIDSLVSTVGLLSGISAAGASASTIVIAGVIYAFVEAFSMAVGNFLSEKSSEEYLAKSESVDDHSLSAGFVMFASCLLAGFIPLTPYLLWSGEPAFISSIAVSVFALFLAGVWSARLSHLPLLWRGLRMTFLGGAAIAIGVGIGTFAPIA